ncbi:hypothetical protein ACYQOP_07865 [Methylobacterium sp. CM6247]
MAALTGCVQDLITGEPFRLKLPHVAEQVTTYKGYDSLYEGAA